MKVRFTPTGRGQFLSVIRFLLRENPLATGRFRHRAEKVLRRLARFPHSGRKIPEFPEIPFREVPCPRYRLFYRIQENTIWIVAVWHDAQLPEEP